jgi:hypothetical protein
MGDVVARTKRKTLAIKGLGLAGVARDLRLLEAHESTAARLVFLLFAPAALHFVAAPLILGAELSNLLFLAAKSFPIVADGLILAACEQKRDGEK